LQSGDDAAGDSVERRQHAGEGLGAATIGGRDEVFHALLRGFLRPAQRGDGVERGLPGLHNQRAVIDEGLEGVHGAIEEETRVVVVGGTGEQLDVERALGTISDLFAVAVGEAQTVQQRRCLRDSDLVVVEGDVEVDVLVVADQAIVGDHRDVRGAGGVQLAGQCGAVDRGDDQDVRTVGDHLVDLLGLGRDVIVGELQVDLVAGRFQAFLHCVAVSDPALGGLGRHRDADGDIRGVCRATGGPGPTCTGSGTAGERERAHRKGGGDSRRAPAELLPNIHEFSSSLNLVMTAMSRTRGC